MIERTLVVIKPDAILRSLAGEIIERLEAVSFKIVAVQMRHLTREEAKLFYAAYREKDSFNRLVALTSSAPVLALILEGNEAISKTRDLMGEPDPKKAENGTIRGDLGASVEANVLHCSDSKETADSEIALFFDM
jgi:nucleoside-diphosphate kinase